MRKKMAAVIVSLVIIGCCSGCNSRENSSDSFAGNNSNTEEISTEEAEVITGTVTEVTTEKATEKTTEATTEEINELDKYGYDKIFIHQTDFGGNYAIPTSFEKSNEESVQTGLWYEFTDSNTNITIETWEYSRNTRFTDFFASTRELIDTSGYSVELDSDEKIKYSGTNDEGRCFIEIDTLFENVYHYITITFDEDKNVLCKELAEMIDKETKYDKIQELSGRLPLLLYGGSFPLSDEQLDAFSDDEIIEAINEIYANQGLIFEDQELLEYYKGYGWYSPTIPAADFDNSVFKNDNVLRENLDKLRARVNYTPAGVPTGGDVTSYNVETIRNIIIDYYTNKYNPEGEYVIFDTDETNSDTEYSTIIRYRVSAAEAQAILDEGRTPVANVYISTITVNKLTGEVTTDTGETWYME